MNRRGFLKTIGAAAALAVPGCAGLSDLAGKKQTAKKPNFVFILIDDLGWRDLGCYGSTFYETPNIDKLAAEGMRFTDAYAACPLCSPTRASIMTGKYPARLKQTYTPSRLRTEVRTRLIPPRCQQQLKLEEVTIAEALKEAGYATCSVGKWHLGRTPYYPQKQGFDINIAGTHDGSPASYFHPYTRGKNWKMNLPGGEPGEYLTDRLTEEGIKFIEANKDKPFFLYLSHHSVHTPIQAKEKIIEKYKAKAENFPFPSRPRFIQDGDFTVRQIQDDPVFAAMIESTDDSVGRVMTALKDLGIAEDTVIIFTSDNGGESRGDGRPTSNFPLRAGKCSLYEGGIRVPMIVKWPGVTTPGSECNEPVISNDFYPTMLKMAGLPAKPDQHADGQSMVPLLKQTDRLKRTAIYWHFPHYDNPGVKPAASVRAGDYKLIEFFEDNRIELYNLKDDIGEKNDLSLKMPSKASELKALLHNWQREVDAQMPRPNPEYVPKD